ncbi:Protein CBG13453 [Caenorhabditis briggsae]|uniref:Protein CBG13453 n=1 Tax=Caenorhabditis briggsae TaxID=6238 RepID=A8XHQ7_CAEBR|nr:Protein CBG13453 [Caenorhabditis briggsae]CAP32174.2 Protein CBG13453 [Caenorhabditis briggsae]
MAQMFMFQKDENSFLDYNKERSPYFKFSEICITDWEKFWKKLLVKVHVSAIYIAALKYRKTWSEPTLEVILASFPTFLGFSTWILFGVLQKSGEYHAVEMTDLPPSSSSTNQPNSQNLYKTSWLFTCIGILLGAATSLSILVASKE